MAKLKEIALPNSNLYLYGWGTDTNGNNVIKIGFPNRKGFSIQTNGVLPFSNSAKNTSLSDLTETDIEKIEKEVVAYITTFGSKSQKSVIKKYAIGGGVGNKYYVTYASSKKGFDLYSTDENENSEMFIGNYEKLEQANKIAEEKGLKKKPMYNRYATGGGLNDITNTKGESKEFVFIENDFGIDYFLRQSNDKIVIHTIQGGFYRKNGVIKEFNSIENAKSYIEKLEKNGELNSELKIKYATGGGVKKSTDGIKGYEDLYGEDVKKAYYQKKKQAEEKQPKMVRTMFEDEQYEYKTGGKLEDEPRVYIADLAAYNDGKLVGEWINLSDYNDGSEVMEKIDELLKKWSKKAGEEREEYAVHDYENFSANLYSEYMSEESFDKVIKSYNVSKTTGIPADVIATIVREYNPDDVEEWINEHYEGEFNSDTDLAYHYVEQLGGVKELGEKTTDMYFDYESFGRDLSINDFNDYDGHYFRSYAKGGDIKKHDLTKYIFKNMSCYSIGGL